MDAALSLLSFDLASNKGRYSGWNFFPSKADWGGYLISNNKHVVGQILMALTLPAMILFCFHMVPH